MSILALKTHPLAIVVAPAYARRQLEVNVVGAACRKWWDRFPWIRLEVLRRQVR
jgi:hypothetical protein